MKNKSSKFIPKKKAPLVTRSMRFDKEDLEAFEKNWGVIDGSVTLSDVCRAAVQLYNQPLKEGNFLREMVLELNKRALK